MANRLIFLLALLGTLISGYLLNRYITGGPILCGRLAGCETVRASPYAYIAGVPLPAYGLVFYVLVLVTSVAATIFVSRLSLIKLAVFVEAGCGFLVSVYLFSVEVLVIKAVCLWCTASGIVSTAIFLVALWQMYNGKRHELGN